MNEQAKCVTCGKKSAIQNMITIQWQGKPYRVHPKCKFIGAIGERNEDHPKRPGSK